MRKKSITINQATVTVRTQIGWDVSDSQIIYRKLVLCGYNAKDPIISNRMTNFAKCVTQSEIEGDLGIVWVQVSDPAQEVGRAFEAWGKDLAGDDNGNWIAAIINVDEAPGDPALAPPAAEKKESTPPPPPPANI